MEEASRLSPIGVANTYRCVVKTRPQIYTYEDKIAAMTMPTLVVVGELDAPCRKACQFLADTIRGARLKVIPASGHSVNVEEPGLINRLLADFVDLVASR